MKTRSLTMNILGLPAMAGVSEIRADEKQGVQRVCTESMEISHDTLPQQQPTFFRLHD
jgi:hypothetical protein